MRRTLPDSPFPHRLPEYFMYFNYLKRLVLSGRRFMSVIKDMVAFGNADLKADLPISGWKIGAKECNLIG
jgi:hypothetical protein